MAASTAASSSASAAGAAATISRAARASASTVPDKARAGLHNALWERRWRILLQRHRHSARGGARRLLLQLRLSAALRLVGGGALCGLVPPQAVWVADMARGRLGARQVLRARPLLDVRGHPEIPARARAAARAAAAASPVAGRS